MGAPTGVNTAEAYLSRGGAAIGVRWPTLLNQKSLGTAAAVLNPCHSLSEGSGARCTVGGAPALSDLSRAARRASACTCSEIDLNAARYCIFVGFLLVTNSPISSGDRADARHLFQNSGILAGPDYLDTISPL